MLFSKSSAKVQKIIEKNEGNHTKYCNNLQELAKTGKAENKFRTFAVSKGIKGSAQAREESRQSERLFRQKNKSTEVFKTR